MQGALLRKLAVLLAISTCLVGCASLDHVEHYEYQFDPGEGLFPPVRLYFNREQALSPIQVDLINSLRRQIRQVGAFIDFGGFTETPFVIDSQLSWETEMTTGSFAGMMVSAASLGVVPSRHRQQYRLSVSVYMNGELLDRFELEEEAITVMSAYNYTETIQGDAHQLAMGNLARRLIERLDRSETMPRLRPSDLHEPPGQIST